MKRNDMVNILPPCLTHGSTYFVKYHEICCMFWVQNKTMTLGSISMSHVITSNLIRNIAKIMPFALGAGIIFSKCGEGPLFFDIIAVL